MQTASLEAFADSFASWEVVRQMTTANGLIGGVRGGFGFEDGGGRWEEGETTTNDLNGGVCGGFCFVESGTTVNHLVGGGLRWVLLCGWWWEVVRCRTTANGLVGGVCGGFVFVDGGGSTKELVGWWTGIGVRERAPALSEARPPTHNPSL